MLGEPGIDDVDDTVDCKRCLGDVRRHYYLPTRRTTSDARRRWRVKNALLPLWREGGVEGNADEWSDAIWILVDEVIGFELDFAACIFNLLLTCQEEQDITGVFCAVDH